MLNEHYPLGHHNGGHGMSNSQKAPHGMNAAHEAKSFKNAHLERAARIHEDQRGKMSRHGVLMEASPDQMHVNLEGAYKAHHEGQEFGNVLHAMSTPHELQALHSARHMEQHMRDLHVPPEKMNELI